MARRSVCGRREPVRRPSAGSTGLSRGRSRRREASRRRSGRAHFHDHFWHVGRLSCRRSRRFGPRRSRQGRLRRSSGLGFHRFDALLGLKAHIVGHLGAHTQKLIQGHLVQVGQGNKVPISGADSARSHLETAWRDNPSCSASPSWENPRSRRNSARRWAISTFITVPFRVLFVTSRLSPYGFNPGCTSTLCGQFTRTERKISDNHWLPHPRTGNLRLS